MYQFCYVIVRNSFHKNDSDQDVFLQSLRDVGSSEIRRITFSERNLKLLGGGKHLDFAFFYPSYLL